MNTNRMLATTVPSRAPRAFVWRHARRLSRRAGFSLVEVTLAVGIMGFSFVSILGLVPVGLTSFRESKNVSVASQIAQQIFAEVQSTPFTSLVNPSGTGSWRLPPPALQSTTNGEATAPLRNFDEQGQEIPATDPDFATKAIYQVNVRVLSATAFVQNNQNNQNNPNGATAPATNPSLATVSIQIAYNPGRLPMDPSADDANLWTGKSKTITVPMFSYETLVARN